MSSLDDVPSWTARLRALVQRVVSLRFNLRIGTNVRFASNLGSDNIQ